MARSKLSEYRKKRDFGSTNEPAGGERGPHRLPRFVVQKHDATNLHYDFRLEVGGVLKSWSVPKGPSTDPKVKRLAVPTEDHPLEYATFEGTIPRPEYGAGTVKIWDSGTYQNLRETKPGDGATMAQSLEQGKAEFKLNGRRLKGGFVMIRTGFGTRKPGWLLKKMQDEHARPDEPEDENEPKRKLKPEPNEAKPVRSKVRKGPMHPLLSALPDAAQQKLKRRPMPDWVQPMLAVLSQEQPPEKGWVFEEKFDGERCLAFCSGGRVRLLSRNQKKIDIHYPELVDALSKVKEDMVLDGEVVAFAGRRTSFEKLQARIGVNDPEAARASKVKVFYYLFDMPYFAGYDITRLGLVDRKQVLAKAVDYDDPIRYSPHRKGDGKKFLKQACAKGWEGLIAKEESAEYVSYRSPAWLKLKCVSDQELVIGGYTEPQGARIELGALLVGYYDDGKLHYAGKVGTGYSEKTLKMLKSKLAPLERKSSPFADADVGGKGVHWVEPKLVAQIGFAEWTRDARLRQPRFQGLREDKAAREVVRENKS